MQAAEYERLRTFEDGYWWYVAQRNNLLGEIAQLKLPPGARVLDVGCGTGRNLIELVRALRVTGFGVDVSPHAAALWNGAPEVHRCLASLNDLPYPQGRFEVVSSVDVLGCGGIDIPRAFSEMVRVLRGGGHLVLLVPAYQWMRSRHDDAVHSVHRFTRKELATLARTAGLTVARLTHRFPAFFPCIAALRLLRAIAPRDHEAKGKSDLRMIPEWLNQALLTVARVEYSMVRRRTVPFGSTILLVAQKQQQ
jgi:SAM-dependent methyltransferase